MSSGLERSFRGSRRRRLRMLDLTSERLSSVNIISAKPFKDFANLNFKKTLASGLCDISFSRYKATLDIAKVAKWERDHTHKLVVASGRGNVEPQVYYKKIKSLHR